MKTYHVTPHKNHLDETVQIMGHKICFLWRNMANYPYIIRYPFISGALFTLRENPILKRICQPEKQTESKEVICFLYKYFEV